MFVKPEDWKPTPGIAIEGTALEVVKSTSSLSVLAGPGAGKTELLAQRATYLLNTGLCPNPKRILAVAFKADAARNLQERVGLRCDAQEARRFESLTLHAFAKRILDQFREALPEPLRPSPDYKIIFPNRDFWAEFQAEQVGDHPDIHAFNPTQFGTLVQGGVPDFNAVELTARDRLRHLWWKTALAHKPSQISFDMMMLLAMHIVQTQPLVQKAIAGTYTYVFLDEFQDVTRQQYDLIRRIFKETPSVLTAVGDTNQAIMGWAGALPDIFSTFGEDFGAENRKLLFNYRSNSKIVALINDLSGLLTDEPPVPTESARKDDPPPDALEGWVFKTRDAEGAGISNFIKASLEENPELRPHDFVILTRLYANQLEDRLLLHFVSSGIRLRNEARQIGPLAIQDIVKDPVFLFLTALLKMAYGVRDGSPFQVCRDTIASVEGLDLSTDRGAARSLRLVQDLVDFTIKVTKEKTPADFDIAQLISVALPDDRRERLTRVYADYRNRAYLEAVIEACAAFYNESADGAPDWRTLIGNLEGRDAVKIMTIHKSKGLEYHTVIFVEFNDDAFWKNADDVNVFFVALSRARERVRFTLALDSKGFANVERFLTKLQESGVNFKEVV
ncbi:Superfamily I DNA or RNA helicase [Thalassovita litoralis]|uniref:DNA 3'-5' helicase n=1 Tax=Thalassovita litoralis TaxID=1010611 RepID=A0A521FVA9_9RHOB|nr:ATP-dependent helicase [Thalassovita litoralis]SMO99471.1 Superfamily I DNA or RNA helicase [Thalassovita litoralis]